MMFKKIILINRKITRYFSQPLELNTKFEEEVKRLSQNASKILEIGGSDRPLLSTSKLYQYVGVDLDESKNYTGLYDYIHIGYIKSLDYEGFDLIFSQYLMEHVKDAKLMYHEQLKRVKNGGTIIHVYPLGIHPFSICSQIAELVGIKRSLISILRPETISITGYKTYYSLGNVYSLKKFLNNIPNIEYSLHFGYSGSDYFGAFAPIGILVEFFNVICRKFHLTLFASNVIVTIKLGHEKTS